MEMTEETLVNLKIDQQKQFNLNSTEKKNIWIKDEENHRKMWENTKKSNICGIGVPEGEERKHSEEII